MTKITIFFCALFYTETPLMNVLAVDDLVIPICVSEYRRLNPLARMIKRFGEHPLSEYTEFLDDLAAQLYQGYICPPESEDKRREYSARLEKAITEKNSKEESLTKCARYMDRICDVAMSLNEYIYKTSESIYDIINSWCKVHETPLNHDAYIHTMYHVYFFVPIFVEEVITENEEIRNMIIDLQVNVDRCLVSYVGPHSAAWSEFKTNYINHLISPDIIIGKDLHIPAMDRQKHRTELDRALSCILPEKGLVMIIDDYVFARVFSTHPIDLMIDSLRSDYYDAVARGISDPKVYA